MAVIVRETRILGGESVEGVETFKSTRLVTATAEKQARRLDDELRRRMAEITQALRHEGLLELKRRPGVLKLWWELGRRLRFVDSLDVGPPEDLKFVWRAMYDHAPDLVPGPGRARYERGDSHFLYCYWLGEFEWAFVSGAGDWTSWTEFFDSERIKADHRILEWLSHRSGSDATPDWLRYIDASRQNWVRPLAKALRARFKSRDTTVLSTEELSGELDETFKGLTS
jgi:hypothetical protein